MIARARTDIANADEEQQLDLHTLAAPSDEKLGRPPAPIALYDRWENQHWKVSDLDTEADAAVWAQLRAFYQHDMLAILSELEVGEATVTETLTSLIDHAPSDDDRIYLCTQLADEGRHVKFFRKYLTEAAGVDPADIADRAPDYGRVFAPALREVTAAVREADGDPATYYRAIAYYHLVTEGVLAAAGLSTTRRFAGRLGLYGLRNGLANVTRDESRHIAFGIASTRRAVAQGHRTAVLEAYFEAIRLAATVVVAPSAQQRVPAISVALRGRAAQLEANWTTARDRAVRQVDFVGFGNEVGTEVGRVWARACAHALDDYEKRWGDAHPVRAAST